MESGRKDSCGQWEEGEHHCQQQGTVFSMQGSCVCTWTGAAQEALGRNSLHIDTMRWEKRHLWWWFIPFPGPNVPWWPVMHRKHSFIHTDTTLLLILWLTTDIRSGCTAPNRILALKWGIFVCSKPALSFKMLFLEYIIHVWICWALAVDEQSQILSVRVTWWSNAHFLLNLNDLMCVH